MKIFERLIKLITIIYKNKTKIVFNKIKNKDFIIFDRVGSENLINYFEKNDTEILDVRLETLNFFILMSCLLKFKLSLLEYFSLYIEKLKPKIVVTFIDNRILFYQLKNKVRIKSIKYLSVQNGCRRNKNDMGDHLKSFSDLTSDIYFVWGDNISQELSKYIKTKYIPIGSLKNNLKEFKIQNRKREINFISQFRINNSWNGYGDEYFVENSLLPIISNYCDKNNYKFNILCTTDSLDEKFFYNKIMGDKNNLFFYEKKNTFDNYVHLDNSSLNIFIDSAMGYESLARGNKTLACSLRLIEEEESFRFGWPNNKLFESKSYVLNKIDKRLTIEKLDFLLLLSEDEWSNELKGFDFIMEYDPHNKLISKEINELLEV